MAGLSDEALARALLQLGVVSSEQIEAARAAQAEEAGRGVSVTLADMLIRQEILTPVVLANIQQRADALSTLSADLSAFVESRSSSGASDTGSAGAPHVPPTAVQADPPIAIEADPARIRSPRTNEMLGPYRLVRLLGRGGMGAVWEALDTRLNRRVAIKVVLAERDASEKDLERFRREARHIGKLRHPNIVPIHDVGVADGRDYLVMDLVDGVPLGEALRQQQWTYREKVTILEKVARAVQYAHDQGVIHRDLKPSNILIEQRGGGSSAARAASPLQPRPQTQTPSPQSLEPLVMDFGLAKDMSQDSSLSGSGLMVGTPAYMPPEQAQAHADEVGPRSDVYGLGAILYEMLTGRPPFTAENIMALLTAVVMDDPVPPRKIDPKVPRDLECICLKCLEKKPPRRYASATELAEDLRRFLDGESIVARPASLSERAARWARRRPAATALLAVSSLALVAMIAGGLWYNAQLRRERNAAQAARIEAEAAMEAAELENYFNVISLAKSKIDEGSFDQAKALLASVAKPGKRDFRHWEWGRLLLLCHQDLLTIGGPNHKVYCAAISPDGKRLATGGQDSTVRVWGAETGQELLTLVGNEKWLSCIAFSSDGKRLATGGNDGTARIWDAETGRRLQVFEGDARSLSCVAFSPDGRRIVTGGNEGRLDIRDAESGQHYLSLMGHHSEITGIMFLTTGTRVATTDQNGEAKLWDTQTGRELPPFKGHSGREFARAFSPDGKRVLTGIPQDDDNPYEYARILDVETGREIARVECSIEFPVFSPDGEWLVFCDGISYAGNRVTLQVWNVKEGKKEAPLSVSGCGQVNCLSFSPDNWSIAVSGRDRTVRIVDVSGYKELVLKGHLSSVDSVTFSHDGKRVVTCSGGETAKVWSALEKREFRPIPDLETFLYGTQPLALSPDGKMLVGGASDERSVLFARVIHMDPPHESRTLNGTAGIHSPFAFSPNGEHVLAGSNDGTANIWNMETGRQLVQLQGDRFDLLSLAFLANSSRVLGTDRGGNCRIWDSQTGRVILAVRTYGVMWGRGKLLPESHRFTALEINGSRSVWDAETGRKMFSFRGAAPEVEPPISFSPDGQYVVTGASNNEAVIRDAETEIKVLTLQGHLEPVTSAAFSPDGRHVLTGSADRTARMWDASTGRELWKIEEHKKGLSRVAFSPDGDRVLTMQRGGIVKVWDTETHKALLTFQGPTSNNPVLSYSPDGRRILAVDGSLYMGVWDARTGRELPHSENIHSASVDGRRFAAMDWVAAGESRRRQVAKVIEAETQRELFVIKMSKQVNSCALSPDGERLLVVCEDGSAMVYAVETGREIVTLKGQLLCVYESCFSPDGKHIVTGTNDQTLKVWDAATGRAVATLNGDAVYMQSADFSPDGTQVVTGSQYGHVDLWDAKTGRKLLALTRYKDATSYAAFSPDGKRILTWSRSNSDLTLRIWKAEDGQHLLTLRGHKYAIAAAAFSPDGTRIVTGGSGFTAKIWDAGTGQEILTLEGHKRPVESVAFWPDGRRVLTSGEDGMRLWDPATGREILRTEHGAEVIGFTPDGKSVVTAAGILDACDWRKSFDEVERDFLHDVRAEK